MFFDRISAPAVPLRPREKSFSMLKYSITTKP